MEEGNSLLRNVIAAYKELNPLGLFGPNGPEEFIYLFIFLNHSFLGMVRNLVTLLVFGI